MAKQDSTVNPAQFNASLGQNLFGAQEGARIVTEPSRRCFDTLSKDVTGPS
jgi:hypothetical protein